MVLTLNLWWIFARFGPTVCAAMALLGGAAWGQSKTTFFEASYGFAPSGEVASDSFTLPSRPVNFVAYPQYSSSQIYGFEFGQRKAWWNAIDVSLSFQQIQTNVDSVNVLPGIGKIAYTKHSNTHTYALQVYHDLTSGPNYHLQVGGLIGWTDLVDVNARGYSYGLSLGGRYALDARWHASAKLKYMTVPASSFSDLPALTGVSISVPSQNIPSVNLGVGYSF